LLGDVGREVVAGVGLPSLGGVFHAVRCVVLAAGGGLDVAFILGGLLKAFDKPFSILAAVVRVLPRDLGAAAGQRTTPRCRLAWGLSLTSMFRPHRGSRERFTTGAQKVEPAWPAFMSERASWPIWRPVSCQRVRLKAIPVVIGKANFVVIAWLLLTPDEACVSNRGSACLSNKRSSQTSVTASRRWSHLFPPVVRVQA
jgi:hypothetical protein